MKLKGIIIIIYLVLFVLWIIGTIPNIFGILFIPIFIIFIIFALKGGAGEDLIRINREQKQANERIRIQGEISSIKNKLNEIDNQIK